jgi:hypothetical protein
MHPLLVQRARRPGAGTRPLALAARRTIVRPQERWRANVHVKLLRPLSVLSLLLPVQPRRLAGEPPDAAPLFRRAATAKASVSPSGDCLATGKQRTPMAIALDGLGRARPARAHCARHAAARPRARRQLAREVDHCPQGGRGWRIGRTMSNLGSALRRSALFAGQARLPPVNRVRDSWAQIKRAAASPGEIDARCVPPSGKRRIPGR